MLFSDLSLLISWLMDWAWRNRGPSVRYLSRRTCHADRYGACVSESSGDWVGRERERDRE
jgi:hypothetical protein